MRSLETNHERDRMVHALGSIRALIAERYPDAQFSLFDGDDPPGLYLMAVVDVEDPDDVVAIYLDRLVTFQVDDGLPIYVLSVRPRVLEIATFEHAPHVDRPMVSAG